MLNWLYLISFLFLNILNHEPISGQNLSWKNYTTDHGLPGNVVFDHLQDSRGYMWFATNHGICRFNGYEFIQPTDTSDLSGTEAFLPTEDIEGNIWFSRLDGSIWNIKNDTVRAWKYNHIIAPYIARYRPIIKIDFSMHGEVLLTMQLNGFLIVTKEGILKELQINDDDYFLFYKKDGIELPSICIRKNPDRIPILKQEREFKLAFWDREFIHSELKFKIDKPRSVSHLEILNVSKEKKIVCFDGYIFFMENGQVKWTRKLPMFSGKGIITSKQKIMIPAHTGSNPGLFVFESVAFLKEGKMTNVLPDRLVTRISEDKYGGFWASTHHSGVFYCKNPDMEIFNKESGIAESDILCLTHDGKHTIFAGTRPAGILKINIKASSFSKIPPPPNSREIEIIFYNHKRNEIWAEQNLSRYDGSTWHPLGVWMFDNQHFAPLMAKMLTPDADMSNVWISSTYGFSKVNLESGQAEQFGQNGSAERERTFSVTPAANHQIWVTTTNGIKLWNKEGYRDSNLMHPLLYHHQCRQILFLHDSSMVFNLSGKGLLIKNKQNEWLLADTDSGLVSNNIGRLYLSGEGDLYACSGSGMSILTLKSGAINIVNITEKQGLPSNQVNDVIKFNGIIWIATNMGLVKLKNIPKSVPMPPPLIEKIRINNRLISLNNKAEFGHNENNIRIQFYSLNYCFDGKIKYRFKLIGADSSFTNSTVREVNFANLAAGEYVFQVQSQNEAGEWSEKTEWPFIINPAWWQTAWFWLIVGWIFAAILGIWYRERLKKKQHEFEIAIQIKDLESAAMRAQMNPHFIFNSLSSIQHFIAESDKDAAISYLAKFARLVRLALHGSIDGQHSLREEVEMLENYLSLEQLRFRGKFDFSIFVSNDIDADEIALPPMLVQPFVENALLHGMKNKVDGGKIEISFELNGEVLLATIRDNGPGIQSGNLKFERDGHKSVGMTLTKHRLEILSDDNSQKSWRIQSLTSEEGEVIGTSVTLSIPLN